MITIGTERLLNLEAAARLLPPAREGRPVHAATVLRFIQTGELEGLRIGRRWVTSLEALQRMAERQTHAALSRDAAARTPERVMTTERRRQIEWAERQAEAIWGPCLA
jgi:hypothetical protein